MLFFIFLVSLAVAVTSGRVALIAMRGGIDSVRTPSEAIIGFVGMIAGYVVLVEGFFLFEWYTPILSFLALNFVVGAIVSRAVFSVLIQFVALLDLCVTSAAIYLGFHAFGAGS